MRATMRTVACTAGCHRSLRHRRRRPRHAECLDRGVIRASRPAACRSPNMATATCRRNPVPPTCWKRSASASIFRLQRQAPALRDRPLLSFCADLSSSDEACRAGAQGPRLSHSLQSAGPALQSGARAAVSCWACSRNEWVEPVAGVLADLGTEHAWVVHGRDGMDEDDTGVSHTAVLDACRISATAKSRIAPSAHGCGPRPPRRSPASKAAYAEDNADAIRKLLAGGKGHFATSSLQCRRGLRRRRQGRRSERRFARAAKALDTGAARAFSPRW